MSDDKDLDSLQEKIKSAKASSKVIETDEKTADANTQSSQGLGMGMRAGMEFVVSIVVSVFLGLWLDNTFDTKPFFFIALFFLGVITGFVNVWRVTQGIGSAVGYKNLYDQKAKDQNKGADPKADAKTDTQD